MSIFENNNIPDVNSPEDAKEQNAENNSLSPEAPVSEADNQPPAVLSAQKTESEPTAIPLSGEIEPDAKENSAESESPHPEDNTETSVSADTPEIPPQSEAPIAAAETEKQTKYYEPWQEPVYREPEEPTSSLYSPGLHNPAFHAQPYTTTEPKEEKKKKKSGHGFLRAACIVLACAVFSAGSSCLVVNQMLKNNDNQTPNQVVIGSGNMGNASPNVTTPVYTAGTELSGKEIYNLGRQQVVGIRTDVVSTNIFGQTASRPVSGSGFIISEDGYILTNYHVIEYAAVYGYDLQVMLLDGTSYTAQIIGYESENDIAVIKIDAKGLNAVTLGSSESLSVGDMVYAIGNPLGELDYTMTSGIVSALDRVIKTDSSTEINMFQIDAAVNSGNSGGPVYNSKGEVIGIVTAKYSSTGIEGLGFAIPIDDALSITSDLIEKGYVTGKPYMGINVEAIDSRLVRYYNLPVGLFVTNVESGSCSEKAGIQQGDILTKLGDVEVSTRSELLSAKQSYTAGDTTTVEIYRNGQLQTLTITFDETPAPENAAGANGTPNEVPIDGASPSPSPAPGNIG